MIHVIFKKEFIIMTKTKEKKKKSFIKRLLKWTGISFLVLIILIVLLPILFKDQIVQFIKDQANENLNAELDFGEVNLGLISTFPSFSLEINDLSLKGVGEFEGVSLAEIKQTNLRLDLWSVIGGDQYEISSIGLVEPNIHVKVLPNGKANYDIAKSDSTEVVDEESSEESAPLKLSLEEYYVENGSIIYDDQLYVTYMKLGGLNHNGNAAIDGTTYTVETLTDIAEVTFGYDEVNYLSDALTDVKCNLEIDMPENEMKFTFKENEATLNKLGISFDGWFLMTDEIMDMDLSFKSTKQTFSSLLSMVPGVYSPDFGDMKTDGSLVLEGELFGEYSESSMPGFDLEMVVSNAWFQYPDLPGKVDKIGIDLQVQREAGIDLNNTKVDINKFHLEFAGNEVDASMKLRNIMTDPNIDSRIKTFMDLAKLSEIIPMEEGDEYSGIITSDVVLKGNVSALESEDYENFTAKGDLKIAQMNYQSTGVAYSTAIDSMLFQFSPQNLQLAYFDAKMGESDLHVNGSMNNYMQYFLRDEVLVGAFNVSSNFFNVDELMSASSEVEGEAVAEETVAVSSSDTLTAETIDIPDNINFNLATKIDRILYDSLEMSNFNGDILVNEGMATLKDLSMNVFEGKIAVGGVYEPISKTRAHIDLDLDIHNLDIPKSAMYFNTIEKLVPVAKYCEGTFSTVLSMDTDIDENMEPVYESLTGKGKVKTNKVTVSDFPVMTKISETLKIDKLKSQTLENINISYEFKDGKIWVEPFDLKMGKINSTVEGTTSFMQELDYTMKMEIPKSVLGGDAAELLSGLANTAGDLGLSVGDNIPVNIGIGGTSTNPKITTDLKNQGQNVVDNVIDEVKDKVYDEAQKILAQAQEHADKLLAEAKTKADQVRAAGKESAEKIRKESKAAGEKVKTEGKKAAEKVRKEGYAQAQKLIDDAGSNPIKKKTAEIAAKKLREEADKKADKMIAESNTKGGKVASEGEVKAKKVEDEAELKAKGIENEAQNQADKIMSDANAKAEKIKE